MIRELPGGVRVVCGSSALGARGATGGIRGKLTRHSVRSAFGASGGGIRDFSRGKSRVTWRLGGLPEVVYCLGTRGQMANSGDIRGKSSRCGVFGDTWQFGKNPGGEVFRRRLPEEFAVGLRGHKPFSKESSGSTLGTRGAFRRRDRRVWFEGMLKGAFGEMASG